MPMREQAGRAGTASMTPRDTERHSAAQHAASSRLSFAAGTTHPPLPALLQHHGGLPPPTLAPAPAPCPRPAVLCAHLWAQGLLCHGRQARIFFSASPVLFPQDSGWHCSCPGLSGRPSCTWGRCALYSMTRASKGRLMHSTGTWQTEHCASQANAPDDLRCSPPCGCLYPSRCRRHPASLAGRAQHCLQVCPLPAPQSGPGCSHGDRRTLRQQRPGARALPGGHSGTGSVGARSGTPGGQSSLGPCAAIVTVHRAPLSLRDS